MNLNKLYKIKADIEINSNGRFNLYFFIDLKFTFINFANNL